MAQDLAHKAARLSIAPMMDWTDRHCRYFHRLLSKKALLYTEMVPATALVRGKALHLLNKNSEEEPVALQLGGSDPVVLAEAAKLGEALGYGEINLNVGCPSSRVQSGTFGAILMKYPELVADCCAAISEVINLEVTVKCRIGLDDQNPKEILPNFISTVSSAGVSRFIIHARKAWLTGLSPKDNRNIPSLDYDIVHSVKAEFPNLHISLNGGINSLKEAEIFLKKGIDGVMIGRAAYKRPFDILGGIDQNIFGMEDKVDAFEVVHKILPYIELHLKAGGKLNEITRHMLGLFNGRVGARMWRRVLSEGRKFSGPEVVIEALSHVGQEETA